jgi:hypothetical protein
MITSTDCLFLIIGCFNAYLVYGCLRAEASKESRNPKIPLNAHSVPPSDGMINWALSLAPRDAQRFYQEQNMNPGWHWVFHKDWMQHRQNPDRKNRVKDTAAHFLYYLHQRQAQHTWDESYRKYGFEDAWTCFVLFLDACHQAGFQPPASIVNEVNAVQRFRKAPLFTALSSERSAV